MNETDPQRARNPPPPGELEHALRHLEAAVREWDSHKPEFALMHLREAITDATWVLFQWGAHWLHENTYA